MKVKIITLNQEPKRNRFYLNVKSIFAILDMFKIEKFTFNPLAENTLVIYENGKAIVIDPGMYFKEEQVAFSSFLEDNGLTLEKIITTHCHLDHVAGVRYLQEKYKIPFLIPEDEQEILKMAEISAGMYGLNEFQVVEEFEIISKSEKTIDLLGYEFQILFVPGHSPGHIAFYNKKSKVLINGDVLFKGSIGRYDLPGGSLPVLANSIKNVLFGLPDDTVVYCGHGEETTIGFEKKYNMINNL